MVMDTIITNSLGIIHQLKILDPIISNLMEVVPYVEVEEEVEVVPNILDPRLMVVLIPGDSSVK